MENDNRAVYKEIVRTPQLFLEIAAELAMEHGLIVEAQFYITTLEWKRTAVKIARTPFWRYFKVRRLFQQLDHLEHEVAYLHNLINSKEADGD